MTKDGRRMEESMQRTDKVAGALTDFTEWLGVFGETSWDYQSFFAGPIGERAKALYYRDRVWGTAAVAPMIFCEAVLPSGRRLCPRPLPCRVADAHRAFLLTSASRVFSNEDYWRIAKRNLNFILENQNQDGSWYYAVDGVRDFIDHYHTCFVMKALAKIHTLTGDESCKEALSKAVKYYLANLFDEEGLPKPFSKAPRLTVYKRELYDWAECVNLCLLLRDRFPQLETTLQTVIDGILKDWIKPDGSFRSRRLYLGWDNVPMHRWAQSQMFRSLAFYFREAKNAEKLRPDMVKRETREPGVCATFNHS